MNIVFWFLVLVIAAAVWWLLSPAFREIGDSVESAAKAVKDKFDKEKEK